jgi:hypothetical protein
MSTCVTCRGRIDAHAFEMRTKVATKLGIPVTPPKRCSECTWEALLALACTEDAPEQSSEGDHG